jgi:hypothetical protein
MPFGERDYNESSQPFEHSAHAEVKVLPDCGDGFLGTGPPLSISPTIEEDLEGNRSADFGSENEKRP